MTPDLTRRRECVSLGLLVAAVAAYAFWLTHGTFQLIDRPSGSDLNLTFNSMLERMSRGRFDVDPDIVGREGFLRGGRAYAYWGVLPALLRIPLLFFSGGLGLDVTALSSLLAVTTAATMKFQTLRVTFRSVLPQDSASLYWALLLALLFGGAQIEFLKPSVYQEVCLWAGAFGACFVFVAIRGLLLAHFSVGSLCSMAAFAGLALLTRASTGVGLYASIALLLLLRQTRAVPVAASPIWKRTLEFARGLSLSRSVVLPVAILSLFVLLTGFVNHERWGDPLQFADYHAYRFNYRFPDRLVRLQQYGLFNLERIPFGLLYYFLPIWVLQRNDGQLFFQDNQTRLFDAVELPPSSFLLTDTLLLALSAYLFWALAKQRKFSIDNRLMIAVAAGLSVACLLMLSASTLSFRYRIDFYPFVEFTAFVGAAFLLQSPLLAKGVIKRGLLLASVTSIFASHAVLLLYKISYFGSGIDYLKPGLLPYYMQQLEPHLARFH